jgi:predicted ATPase
VLTRLEVHGFKNLLNFSVDLGPYTCIAGANAVGKSNIFDAIAFLSLLADHPFLEAARMIRPVGQGGGDPRALFWQNTNGAESSIILAAEMIVPESVEDDFGRQVRPTTSFVRYEIELRYVAPEIDPPRRSGRIQLVREELRHIRSHDVPGRLPWARSKKTFRDSVVFGRRSGTAYISTTGHAGSGVVNVHQDGGGRGRPRTSLASRAPRTVVSTTSTSDDPTILAARRGMQQWRMLALEPSAMRRADVLVGSSTIAVDSSHLAAALNRLSTQDVDSSAQVAAAAAALTDIREVTVDVDPTRELLTLQARLGRDGPMLAARALSDGTLRSQAMETISVPEILDYLTNPPVGNLSVGNLPVGPDD